MLLLTEQQQLKVKYICVEKYETCHNVTQQLSGDQNIAQTRHIGHKLKALTFFLSFFRRTY